MGIVSSIVYVGGIPLLFATLLLIYRRQSHERRVKYWLGNLYYCYRPSMYWFELVILVRRLALAVLISVVPASSPVRAAAIVVVLWVALVVQHLVAPFVNRLDNRLEEVSIGIVLFTFITQTLWRAYSQLHSAANEQLAFSWSIQDSNLLVDDPYVMHMLFHMNQLSAHFHITIQLCLCTRGSSGGAQSGNDDRAVRMHGVASGRALLPQDHPLVAASSAPAAHATAPVGSEWYCISDHR